MHPLKEDIAKRMHNPLPLVASLALLRKGTLGLRMMEATGKEAIQGKLILS